MNGYGIYVWSSFLFTFLICLFLFLKTKKSLIKLEKDLLSHLGSAVTGEIHHVDCGYHTVGMVAVDEAKNVSDLLSEFDKK